jgi:3'5'-cyclic nucleotide phosphodiesterase
MKVNPAPVMESHVERHLTEGETKVEPLNKYSLRFNNKKIEKSYLASLLSSDSPKLQVSFNENHKYFLLSIFGVLCFYNVFYILSYRNKKSFIFQIVSLNFFSVFLMLKHYLIQKQYIKQYGIELLGFCYTCTCVSLSLNSFPVQEFIFGSKNTNFTCILGILVLQGSSKFIILFTFRSYIISNTIIAVAYLILHLASDQKILITILEFLVFILVVIVESFKFYNIELNSREIYAISVKTVSVDSYEGMTEIEGISSGIHEALNIVDYMLPDSDKYKSYLQSVHQLLNKILKTIISKNNIYEVDIEGVTHGMDVEDKLFIEQYFKKDSKSKLRGSKNLERKTFEMVKSYDVEDLLGVLKQIGNQWNFDIFFLSECTTNKPVITVGKYGIVKYRLDDVFSISKEKSLNFFEKIETSYKSNPYHNSTHAADVLCSFLFILHQSLLISHTTDYELLACIIANLGHDIGHPGYTNRFLVNNKDPLALICKVYIDNDLSVLEMMHSSLTFQILQENDCNILCNLSNDTYIAVRVQVIEMILATDMSKHFDLLGKLKAKIINSPNRPIDTPEHRLEVMKVAIKAADVGHAAKSRDLHLRWTDLIVEEFFAQGDLEKEKGLVVSMYCDRNKASVPKSQSGFIKNIVLPIYESLNNYINSTAIENNCIEQLKRNLNQWDSSSTKKRIHTVVCNRTGAEESHPNIRRLGSDIRYSNINDIN